MVIGDGRLGQRQGHRNRLLAGGHEYPSGVGPGKTNSLGRTTGLIVARGGFRRVA